jgi:hypothetical protein
VSCGILEYLDEQSLRHHKGKAMARNDSPTQIPSLNGVSAREVHNRPTKPIWQKIMDMGDEIPIEEWQAAVPSDLSKNVDCYLYNASENHG